MDTKLVAALFASLLVIPSALSSCGGCDCVEQSCAGLFCSFNVCG